MVINKRRGGSINVKEEGIWKGASDHSPILIEEYGGEEEGEGEPRRRTIENIS